MLGKPEFMEILTEETAKESALAPALTSRSVNSVNEAVKKSMLRAIERALVEDDGVKFVGFGTFSKESKPEREGRNPRTGEAMAIPAHKAVRFSPGAQLKDAVNDK